MKRITGNRVAGAPVACCNGPMSVRHDLQRRLTQGLRTRDRAVVAACRTALAAIANAEAVPVEPRRTGAIEHSPVGVAAAEAPRRHLGEDEIRSLVRSELVERREALGYATGDRSDRLAAEIRVLEEVLDH